MTRFTTFQQVIKTLKGDFKLFDLNFTNIKPRAIYEQRYKHIILHANYFE